MFNTPPQKSLKLILSCDNRCGRLLLLYNILHTSDIGPTGKPSAILGMHLPSKHYTWENKSCTKLYSFTLLPGTDLRVLVSWGERVPVSSQLHSLCALVFFLVIQASLDCLRPFLV